MKPKKILLLAGILFITVFIIIVFNACENNNLLIGYDNTIPTGENASLATTGAKESNPFTATIGAPIAVATGKHWIANYKRMNGGRGLDYILPAEDLKLILSYTDCVGICFYFALDENQNPMLLPIGINTKGQIMKTDFINTPKGPITWETAQKWIANDNSPIDARYFGRNTFNRLFRDKSLICLRAINAVDENLKPQLLLGNAAIDYQNLSSTSTLKFEDMSAVCPPVCPIQTN